MADQVPTTVPDQALLSREVNRRNFLRGATPEVVKHSLITVPAIALVLSSAAVPTSAQAAYGSSSSGPTFSQQFLQNLANIFRQRRNLAEPTTVAGIRG